MSPDQETFNAVWDWFVVQKKPRALNSNGTCVYRNGDGARCAVGLFIPDDKYSRDFDVFTWPVQRLHTEGKLAAPACFADMYLLGHLQAAHDECTCFEELERQLRAVADTHNLTVPEETP